MPRCEAPGAILIPEGPDRESGSCAPIVTKAGRIASTEAAPWTIRGTDLTREQRARIVPTGIRMPQAALS